MSPKVKAAITLGSLVTITTLILLSDKGIIPEMIGTVIKVILGSMATIVGLIFIWFATVEIFKSDR